MKMLRTFAIAICVIALAACAATLHAPTDPGNVATTGNVGSGAVGLIARQYLALPICANPPVYPCATQALKDRVFAADTAAYNAAVAAAAAGATAADKQAATDQAKALKAVTDEPDVKTQTDLAAKANPAH